MESQYTASVLIPTYNRPVDLDACLWSIVGQTELPNEVVIVDDGQLPRSFVDSWSDILQQHGVYFVYRKKDHTKERRGLSESKNIGLSLVSNPICFIFDDDVVLDSKYIEKTMGIWRTRDSKVLMAVGGVIQNARRKSYLEKIYNHIFCLTSQHTWDVNKNTFQVWDDFWRLRLKVIILTAEQALYV